MLISSTFNICEICGEPRSKRVHSKCSRILQRRRNNKEYCEEYKKITQGAATYDMLASVNKSLSVRLRNRK